jgi:isopentenyl-diphosphate delta-isomerase
MEKEMIDVVDDKGQVIDTITREEAELNNRAIQNVIVFVFSSFGKVWIQKRPKHKNHFPGLWDVSACGAVHSGEKPQDAAEREQLEEMGFTSDLHFVETFINKFIGHNGQPTQRLSHLFVGISEEIPAANDEVDEFQAIPHSKLRKNIVQNQNKYIPSFLIELDKAVAAFKRDRRQL